MVYKVICTCLLVQCMQYSCFNMMCFLSLQSKLELLTGSLSGNMKLEAYDRDNKLVCKLDNDGALLGSYPIDDGMIIHASQNKTF